MATVKHGQLWAAGDRFDVSARCPLYPRQRPDRCVAPSDATGRYCCKSRMLQRHEFFAKTKCGRRSLIRIPSIALPKSPVNLTREDRSPHVFTRKSHRRPAEFSSTSAKRLLQQYRPLTAAPGTARRGRYWVVSSTGQCNTSRSLSAGVLKPKVFRGR